MYLNNGTNSYISGFLQAFLKENFDETVEVSNVYNKNTHKTLIDYIQYPEIKTATEVISLIKDFKFVIGDDDNASTYDLDYLFTITNNINNIELRCKSAYDEEKWFKGLSDGLFSLKKTVYNYGWFLMYYKDDDNRFISHLNSIKLKEYFPRKDICSMVNLAGLDYIDNYYIKNPNSSRWEVNQKNPYISKVSSNTDIYCSIIDQGSNTPISAAIPWSNMNVNSFFPQMLHFYFKTPIKGTLTEYTQSGVTILGKKHDTYVLAKGPCATDQPLAISYVSIETGEVTPFASTDYGWEEGQTDTVWVDTTKVPSPTSNYTLTFNYYYYVGDFGGFGDESEFYNNTSFKFKLTGEKIVSVNKVLSELKDDKNAINKMKDFKNGTEQLYYIDKNGTEHDMMGLYSSDPCTLTYGILLFLSSFTEFIDASKATIPNRFEDVIIQVFLIPRKKRLYLVNNIESGKYYALSHAYDFPVAIKYVFSADTLSSKKIREEHFPSLLSDSNEISLKKGEVIIVKSPEDPSSETKSLLVAIDVPTATKKGTHEVGTNLIYGDLNQDGELNMLDAYIAEEKGTNVLEYSDAQKLVMKSKEGLSERTADYTEITVITADQWEDTYKRITETGTIEYLYAPVPTEIKPIYIYVGRVSDYLTERINKDGVPTYPEGQTIETEIAKVFQNLNFNENPFLVHSKFIDFLLDSSIHKYSEEPRIQQIYELVGYDEPYSGYTDELKKIIYNYQRLENSAFQAPTAITFATGYPDVETLYYLKEGT